MQEKLVPIYLVEVKKNLSCGTLTMIEVLKGNK